MNSVNFLPWVGTNYSDGIKGKKVLVLGESHYQWDCPRDINQWRTVTRELIDEQINGGKSKAFWTKIAISFIGHLPNIIQKREFWHSVAFYNYVQESAGSGPRIAPNGLSWQSSEQAFFEVLRTLEPDFVLALGDRLCARLPHSSRVLGSDINGAPRTQTWIYPTSEGKTCLLYGIIHPSRGFNGRLWKPFIDKAITQAE